MVYRSRPTQVCDERVRERARPCKLFHNLQHVLCLVDSAGCRGLTALETGKYDAGVHNLCF